MKYTEMLMPLPSQAPPWRATKVVRPVLEFGRRSRKRRADVQCRRSIYGQEARQYVKREPLSELLKRALATMSTGCSRKDYMFLHRYVLAKKPKAVLELGSGVTSLVIADALRTVANEHGEEARGHLHTMENIPEYHENARSLCPSELAKYVTYHCSPAKCFTWRDQVHAVGYETVPEGPFDFIFVDGPNAPPGGPSATQGGAIDADALRQLDLWPKHYADIVMDARFDTARTYSRFFRRGSSFMDHALNLSFFPHVRGEDLRRVPRLLSNLPDGNIFMEMNV